MSWLTDLFKSPKIQQPTIDANKSQSNDAMQKWVLDMVKNYQDKNPYGTSVGDKEFFAQHPYYNPKAVDQNTLNSLQQKITPVGGSENQVLDSITQGGEFLRSGVYDPTLKALTYEQATRGIDDQRDKDLRGMAEMFGGRGLMRTSAMAGKTNDIRNAASDRKANVLGQVALADLNTARGAQDRDTTQAIDLDAKKFDSMMRVMGFGQNQSSGSQFTPQSMQAYQDSLNKKQSWDNTWNTIIGAAGKFF